MSSILQPLVRKLNRFVPLSEPECAALCRIPVDVRHCLPQEDIAVQGQCPDGVAVVLRGFAVRYKLLPDGRRPIVGFCLPGDVCDLRVELVRNVDHSIGALTALVAGTIAAADLDALMESQPRIARALWSANFVEEAIARAWIVNVGYRSALERLAHLFCELYFRLEAVGLATGGSCELPIRQSELADSLALSAVHVNRTLMELRRSGWLSIDHRRLVIHDMAALREAAGFDPSYLDVAPGDVARLPSRRIGEARVNRV